LDELDALNVLDMMEVMLKYMVKLLVKQE